MTVSELLMDILSNEDVDSIEKAVVIVRQADGTIGYRSANVDFAEIFGLLRFAQVSMENDLKNEWDKG